MLFNVYNIGFLHNHFSYFLFWQIKDLKNEFLAYKDRAHALLQKKDAEIAAAKDSELFKAQEEALNVFIFIIYL